MNSPLKAPAADHPHSVSVVLPCHRTRDSLGELLARLTRACPAGTEYVVVDDACPERTGDLVLAEWSHLPGRLLRTRRNVGQHAAVQAGLRHALGQRVVVMDADLQDAPEDVPVLLAGLDRSTAGLVCAARRGDYAGPIRRRTARVYRHLATLLSGGRIPHDAGMFSAMSHAAVAQIVALEDHAAPLIPAAARAKVTIATVPVTRHRRLRGSSATGSWRRIRIAVRGLLTLTPAQPVLRRLQPLRRRPPELAVVELSPAPSSTLAEETM